VRIVNGNAGPAAQVLPSVRLPRRRAQTRTLQEEAVKKRRAEVGFCGGRKIWFFWPVRLVSIPSFPGPTVF
jgi:hypothetical protein